MPGVGPLVATALVAAAGNGSAFAKARDLSAWLGLVPKQQTTGGKPKLLGISKRGNPYVRKLFIHRARSLVLHLKRERHAMGCWLSQLEPRTHRNVATIALANKLARICWVILARRKLPSSSYARIALSTTKQLTQRSAQAQSMTEQSNGVTET